MAALDEPRSAGALSEETDIPLSTTYRKLDRLEAASLVTTRTAYRADGHHTEQYALDFAAVRIARAHSGNLVATVEGHREPEEQLAAMWTAVGNEA